MVRLGKLLNWCFALGAGLFFLVALSLLPGILDPHHAESISLKSLDLGAMVVLLFLASLFATAWWTLRRGKKSARGWALAVSGVNVLTSLTTLTLKMAPVWPQMAIGVSGLVVFWRRDVVQQIAAKKVKPAHLPGDGTSKLIDTLVRLGAYAGGIATLFWWDRWAHARHLPSDNSLSAIIAIIVLADLISVAAHELGHATAGWALGMRLRSFVVGPFEWRVRDGRWKFHFDMGKVFATGGHTAMVHTRATDPLWWDVLMTAAGPVTSLCIGLVALWATFTAKGRPWEPAWELLAIIAVFSLFAFVTNLIPALPEANYSDGAHIYQILSGGPWADVRRAFSISGSTLVTPLRPRDYDLETVQRAAAHVTQGRQALFLRLFAYWHLFDQGRIQEALEALTQAESVCEESASDVPAEVYADFVFGDALLKHDAAAARRWWDRMEAAKPRRDSVDYWLARSALFWIENRPEEAREAWTTGNAAAEKLPPAGAYEFDRYRFAQLRQAFDASPSPLPA
jgi:Zn-dependent protease